MENAVNREWLLVTYPASAAGLLVAAIVIGEIHPLLDGLVFIVASLGAVSYLVGFVAMVRLGGHQRKVFQEYPEIEAQVDKAMQEEFPGEEPVYTVQQLRASLIRLQWMQLVSGLLMLLTAIYVALR